MALRGKGKKTNSGEEKEVSEGGNLLSQGKKGGGNSGVLSDQHFVKGRRGELRRKGEEKREKNSLFLLSKKKGGKGSVPRFYSFVLR